MQGTFRLGLAVVALAVFSTKEAHADTQADRFNAAGYFRLMTRPDFQGGDSRLGFWNLYGRLLNEGPWASLELRLALLPKEPGTRDPWTAVHTKIEGGSVSNVDAGGGRLENYLVSQLYVEAGNVLIDGVTWRLGTLDSYFGDLGLYDMRPAQVFFETVGVSARYQKGNLDLLFGMGDSGFFLRGDEYNTILTVGATARLRLGEHLELGAGGQVLFEPKVDGNQFAPNYTPGVDYEDFLRGEVVEQFLIDNPGQEDLFTRPVATASASYKAVGYLGFGKLGPLRWSNMFASFKRLHPDNFVVETVADRDYKIYTRQLTDERFQLTVGNEMQLRIIPDRLDVVWAVLYGKQWDRDNDIAAGDSNRTFYSTVLRTQFYLSRTLHLLAESSVAKEISDNGNVFRRHSDSVFVSTNGISDPRGLEFGDSDTRTTWQGKFGWVINPAGTGIYTRPSIRVLYGVQYSTQNNAFGNGSVESLDDANVFDAQERHLHHVLALEAEAWF